MSELIFALLFVALVAIAFLATQPEVLHALVH